MTDFSQHPLFADAPVACSILSPDGRQVAANARFYEMFGYEVGADLSSERLTHVEDQAMTSDYLRDVLADDTVHKLERKRYVRADGSTFWGSVSARRISGPDGSTVVLGVIEDLTPQHELENQLRQAVDDKLQFVAQVSHELRNPLNTISGLAELLETGRLDPAEQRQAGVIREEANALTRLVGDLLDLCRASTDHLTVTKSTVPLRPLVDRVLRRGASTIESWGKDLRLDATVCDDVPGRLWTDGGRLVQIMTNLVVNAVKFTATGVVGVEVSASIDEVRFRVTDTGPGIPRAMADEIFEPFGRIEHTARGAGLGLAISRQLALLLGGSLELERTGPGGSTFLLTLPSTAPIDDQSPSALPAVDRPRREPAIGRILVVEDSEETQLLVASQLERLGYRYDIVGDGLAALERCQLTRYAAALVDWHLPGMDGLEFMRRFRAREAQQGIDRTPLVAVTARTMPEDLAACEAAGADDHLAKPASLAAIADMLEKWAAGSADGSPEPEEDTSATGPLHALSTILEETGSPEVVESIARTYLDQLDGRTMAVRQAWPDTAAVTKAAHLLKGTSAMVGAAELSIIAGEIESAARADRLVDETDLDRLDQLAVTTARTLGQALEQLRKMS